MPAVVPAVTDPVTAVGEAVDPVPSPAVEDAVPVLSLGKLLEPPSPHAALSVKAASAVAVTRACGTELSVVTIAKAVAKHKNDAKPRQLLGVAQAAQKRTVSTANSEKYLRGIRRRCAGWFSRFTLCIWNAICKLTKCAPAQEGNQLRRK